MFKFLFAATCLLLLTTQTVAAPQAGPTPFDECGELIDSGQSCGLPGSTVTWFRPDVGGEYFMQFSFAPFVVGDRVRITGTLDTGCIISCPSGLGCLDGSIVSCPPLPSFTDSCNGDGGNQMGCTNCPCTNNMIVGTVGGCLNSAGTAARLLASGDTSVSLPSGDTSDLRFGLTGAPANAFCILNSGDAVAPGNMANPCFGLNSGSQAAAFDGLRCAIMNTRRHGGRSADGNGDVGTTNNPWGGEAGPPVGLAVAGGGFAAGQTRYFQVINRDDPSAVCMRGLNTSQAVEVTFNP